MCFFLGYRTTLPKRVFDMQKNRNSLQTSLEQEHNSYHPFNDLFLKAVSKVSDKTLREDKILKAYRSISTISNSGGNLENKEIRNKGERFFTCCGT